MPGKNNPRGASLSLSTNAQLQASNGPSNGIGWAATVRQLPTKTPGVLFAECQLPTAAGSRLRHSQSPTLVIRKSLRTNWPEQEAAWTTCGLLSLSTCVSAALSLMCSELLPRLLLSSKLLYRPHVTGPGSLEGSYWALAPMSLS